MRTARTGISRLNTVAVATSLLLVLGCGGGDTRRDPVQPSETAASATPPPAGTAGQVAAEVSTIFVDVTADAGVDFLHRQVDSEAIPQGAGVVAFDFNNDGFGDIYVSNSVGPNALYRNNGDGTFTDVAVAAGVDDRDGRGNGAAPPTTTTTATRTFTSPTTAPAGSLPTKGTGPLPIPP